MAPPHSTAVASGSTVSAAPWIPQFRPDAYPAVSAPAPHEHVSAPPRSLPTLDGMIQPDRIPPLLWILLLLQIPLLRIPMGPIPLLWIVLLQLPLPRIPLPRIPRCRPPPPSLGAPFVEWVVGRVASYGIPQISPAWILQTPPLPTPSLPRSEEMSRKLPPPPQTAHVVETQRATRRGDRIGSHLSGSHLMGSHLTALSGLRRARLDCPYLYRLGKRRVGVE